MSTRVTAADAIILVIVVAFVALLVLWGVMRRRQGHSAIRAALAQEGLAPIRIEHRVFRQGPLWRTTTRSQTVYRVVARDATGRERTAWARWGRTWLFARDALEWQWDR